MIEVMRGMQVAPSSLPGSASQPNDNDPLVRVNASPNAASAPNSNSQPDVSEQKIAQAPNQAKPKSNRGPAPQKTPPPEQIAYPTKEQTAQINTDIERTTQEIARRQGVWDEILRTPPKIEPGNRAHPTLLPDDWEKEANRENPNYAQWIKEAAEREHIPVLLLARLLYKESVFTATAGSKSGAKGIAQLTPNALKEMNDEMDTEYNPKAFKYYDAKTSIDAGAAYLAYLHRKFGDWPAAVGSYNAGPIWMSKWRGGMTTNDPSDETKTMLQRIFRTNPKAFGD
jgi:soluble lytic murein transglycosylase-like protein